MRRVIILQHPIWIPQQKHPNRYDLWPSTPEKPLYVYAGCPAQKVA